MVQVTEGDVIEIIGELVGTEIPDMNGPFTGGEMTADRGEVPGADQNLMGGRVSRAYLGRIAVGLKDTGFGARLHGIKALAFYRSSHIPVA